MGKKCTKVCRQVLALMMVLTMVLGSLHLNRVVYAAEGETEEEPEDAAYTFVCMADQVQQKLSDAQVVIWDEGSTELVPQEGVYTLEVGKTYHYEVSGERLQTVTKGTVTAEETDQEYVIRIPLENLKYHMDNKTCFAGGTVSMQDGWIFDWVWTSSDPAVATVGQDGVVTGIKPGTVTITREYSTLHQEAVVTVEEKAVACRLALFCAAEATPEDLKVEVIRNGKKVQPDADGIYQFLPENEYTYTVLTKGMQTKDHQAQGTFQAPAYSENTETVNIILDYTEPVFEIDGNAWETVDRLRADQTVTLRCTNYSDLYDSEKLFWEYAAKDQEKQKLTAESFEVSYQDAFSIDCTLGTKKTAYQKETFETYHFVTTYDDRYPVAEASYFINGTEIKEEDLEPGQQYTITVRAKGFEDGVNEVKTTAAFPNISLKTGAVIQPVISVPEENRLSGYVGSTLTLSGVTVSEHAEGLEWSWYCVKDGDTSVRLEVTEQEGKLLIPLTGGTGDYQLYYGCGEAVSNEVAISILRVPVEIDWEKLPEQKKIYDGTPDFEFTLKVQSDAVFFPGADKTEFTIKPEDQLTIRGKVASAETGFYDALEVSEIADDQGLYDVSGIGKKAEGLTDRFEICQVVLAADLQNLKLCYRVNTIEDPSGIVFKDAADTEGKLAQELLSRMGNVQNVTCLESEQKVTCTFSNVKYDEESKLAYIGESGENVRFEFPGLKEYDGKNLLFTMNLIPEQLSVSPEELNRMLTVKQEGTEGVLQNESWCSDRPVTALVSEGTEYYGETGYTAVQFHRMGEDTEVSSQIPAGEVTEDAYYEILLSKGDASWPYICTAGYMHIIAEDYSAQADHGQTMEVDGRTYPVLHLVRDTSAPRVLFSDSMQSEGGRILLDGRSIPNIRFELENSGFEVAGIQYQFMNQTGRLSDGYVMENDLIDAVKAYDLAGSMTELAVNGDPAAPYTVSCPEQDGDYVLVVKTTNSAGVEGYYCSKAFAVDHIAPEITVTYFENQKDVSEEVAASPYRSQAVSVKLDLDEMHIDDLQIEVKAVNRKGDTLFSMDAGAYEQALSQLTYDSRGGFGTVTIPFAADANYDITIRAKDKAGNETGKQCHFTLDRSVPNKGKIAIEGTAGVLKEAGKDEKGILDTVRNSFTKTFEKLYSNIRYTIIGDETIKYTLTGSDEISPVDICYYISMTELTEEALKDLREDSWLKWDDSSKKTIAVNTKCVLYERVRDMSGNCSYFSTEGMLTDNQKPEITITLGAESNANGFYHGDVTFSAKVEDGIPEGAAVCSGLSYVSYYLKKDGAYQEGELLLEKKGDEVSQVSLYEIAKQTISAGEYNSNAVVLCITAVDGAGNRIVEEKEIKIDSVKPQVQVTYDDQPGAQYYNRARTATIRIRERNLDTDKVKLQVEGAGGGKAQIGAWSHSGEPGVSDDTVYTCRVTFSQDDSYTFSVTCEDQAGNPADRTFSDRFILDATAPVIAVTYNGIMPEQNAFYNAPVTATITITEHNFSADKVDIHVSADQGSAPGVSGFAGSGDVHTATVSCDRDGTFGIDVAYTDEAGNPAESYKGSRFTVDLTDPVIEIEGVEDQSANKEEVKPVITCRDENYMANQVSVRLTGSNHGEVELSRFAQDPEEIEKGQVFRFDFPKEQDVDDVYTLTVEMTDQAGNHTEKSIAFSVNRFGSVYTLDTETAAWLKNGECAYLQDAEAVVIIETNVDEITERHIAFTQGGVNTSVVNVKELGQCSQEEKEKGAYYEVKKTGKAGKWHQYAYTISKENFLAEGRYSIQIDSTDEAGNHTSNVSNRHKDGNLSMDFAVDQTPPSVVVTGAQEGALYNEISHLLYLDVQDNLGLKEVTVFLNGTPLKTYGSEELAALNDEMIPVQVDQSVSKQKVSVMARDLAGNVLGGNGGGKYDKSFTDFELLVTTNLWVRLIHTTWLWVTALVAAAGLAAVFLLRVRKKGVNNEI